MIGRISGAGIYMFAVLLCLALSTTANAQLVRSGSISVMLDSLATAIPADTGTNIYTVPTAADEIYWKLCVKQILQSSYADAHSSAGSFSYGLTQFTDTASSAVYYILAKTSAGANYWGYYVFNQSAARQKLVIQAPHSLYDFKTELQANYVFRQTGARALFAAGTHRCNSTLYSGCAGTTTVCSEGGESTAFRKSDQAHNVDGAFQFTTFIVDSLISGSIVVQLHGFNKTESDPALIMSNGVKSAPSTDYLTTLKNNLLALDDTLTFKIYHIDTLWTKLTGTTNTQGRLLNASSNICNLSAQTNSGRFLHIEQAYKNLRDNETNWAKMATALNNTFPEGPLPVELSHFSARLDGSGVELSWRTETEVNNAEFVILREEVIVYTGESTGEIVIGKRQGAGNSNAPKEYLFHDKNVKPGRLYRYTLKQVDFDGSFTLSSRQEVHLQEQGYMLYPNFPNPFNPATTIAFYLPETSEASLTIYNAAGEETARLINGKIEAGYHVVQWDGKNVAGQGVSGGVYFYRLKAGSVSLNGKMVYLK